MERNLDVNPAFVEWRKAPEKEPALQELVKRLTRFAKAICWRRLPDHGSELDALVNTIVWRAIKKAPAFREQSRFSTWFHTIAVNECCRYLRNYKRLCETGLETEAIANESATDSRLDLITLLDTLAGDEHLLFRLVAEGQDFNAIGAALQITRNAAIVRWSRLKEKLRDGIV